MHNKYLNFILLIFTISSCGEGEKIRLQKKISTIARRNDRLKNDLITQNLKIKDLEKDLNQSGSFIRDYTLLITQIISELNLIGEEELNITIISENPSQIHRANIVKDLEKSFSSIRDRFDSVQNKLEALRKEKEKLQNEKHNVSINTKVKIENLKSNIADFKKIMEQYLTKVEKLSDLLESEKVLTEKLEYDITQLIQKNGNLNEQAKCFLLVRNKHEIKKLKHGNYLKGIKTLRVNHGWINDKERIGFRFCGCDHRSINLGARGNRRPTIKSLHRKNEELYRVVLKKREWHLELNDPKAFWNISHWLIIRKN